MGRITRLLALVVALLITSSAWAQTVVLRVQWDPNAAAEEVTEYRLYVDSLPMVVVPATLNPACSCIESAQPFATGGHTIKVTAVNLAISTDPTSKQEGPPLTVTFTLNARVDVKNIRIRT